MESGPIQNAPAARPQPPAAPRPAPETPPRPPLVGRRPRLSSIRNLQVPTGWGEALLRSALAWFLIVSLVCTVVSILTDIPTLLINGTSLRHALASGFAGAALGTLLALPAAPLLATFSVWTQRIVSRSRILRRTWPLAVALVAYTAGWIITEPAHSPHVRTRVIIVAGFAAAMLTTAMLARPRHRAFANMAAVMMGIFAGALDIFEPRGYYRELHDLLSFVAISAGLVATTNLRHRLARKRSRKPLWAFIAVAAAAEILVMSVDVAAPAWRAASAQYGRYAPRFGRFARALFDLDGDGFSPVAWGGDCDDFNPTRHPLARDLPGGGDANCNGVDPPVQPTAQDVGLAPPRGSPNAAPHRIDLLLLISIDCMRAEALRPAITPHLWQLAQESLFFSRIYSAGTRTRVSLPLIQRGFRGGRPLAEHFTKEGISSTFILGIFEDSLARMAGAGFGQVLTPKEERWTAKDVVERALVDLRASQGQPQRHYLWTHFLDAHSTIHGNMPFLPTPTLMKSFYLQYLRKLAYIDEQVGRMLDELAAEDRLSRTAIIVTSDHGEGFGEHGVVFHNVSGYEALTHVPAFLHAPGIAPGRYDDLATHRDLYPTMLGAFGLARTTPDAEKFGRSWFRLAGAPSAPLHRFVFTRTARSASGDEIMSPMAVVVHGHYKMVESLEDKLEELYDLEADPEEQRNVAARQPELVEQMRREGALYRDIDQYP